MIHLGIINYGIGNIASIKNAFQYSGFNTFVINSPSEMEKADKIILPGVGAFGTAMKNLNKSGLMDSLNEAILIKQRPIIGLCLGMQLLFETSEEQGIHKGLGWIEGEVKDLQKEKKDVSVPHMGWNTIEKTKESDLLRLIVNDELDFYFVHSYYCKCKNRADVLAQVDYGVPMDVVVQKENIFGCQFHPEKSQKSGLQLLKNFCEI